MIPYARGAACIGDTSYDSAAIRADIKARGMKAVIPSHPTHPTRHLDRELYRKRFMVECFFHRLKRFRAIATRYEKSSTNFLALVHFACAILWLN